MQRIDGRESAVPVLVHSRLGEVEAGFVVFEVPCEFLAHVVLAGAVVEGGRAGTDIYEKLFAKRHEVAAGFDLSERVGDYSRTAEVVGRRIGDCRGLRKLG